MKNTMKKGFTLIELMIVVAIIAIISAIAIPSLMKTKMQSNEAASMGSLKTLHSAQTSYARDFQDYALDFRDLFGVGIPAANYTPNINDMGLYNAGIATAISPDLTVSVQPAVLQAAATAKAGYFFFSNHNYTGQTFMMSATPSTYNQSGNKTYFANQGGTIYEMNPSGVAALDTADEVAAAYSDADTDWDTTGAGGSGGVWSTAQ